MSSIPKKDECVNFGKYRFTVGVAEYFFNNTLSTVKVVVSIYGPYHYEGGTDITDWDSG